MLRLILPSTALSVPPQLRLNLIVMLAVLATETQKQLQKPLGEFTQLCGRLVFLSLKRGVYRELLCIQKAVHLRKIKKMPPLNVSQHDAVGLLQI